MHILSLFSLCYVVYLSNGQVLSNLLSYYLGFRRLCLCRCGQIESAHGSHSRILGGEPIHEQLPWFAYIHTNESTFTGTIISDRHIITAASLVYGLLPSTILVTLGSNNDCAVDRSARNFTVDSIVINPKYTISRRNNDLALLRLSHEVTFNKDISPICMPLYDIGPEKSWAEVASVASENVTCVAHSTSIPVLSERTCLTYANTSLLTPDKGCLGPVGSPGILCETDIGAPVMTKLTSIGRYRLLGVLSSASCYEKEPPLYTKIVYHLPWIKENIQRDCQCL